MQPPTARYDGFHDVIERPGAVQVDNAHYEYAEVSKAVAFSPRGGVSVADYASAV